MNDKQAPCETVIYIHGFLSSPKSYKAQVTRRWLELTNPTVSYLCPSLTPYPEQTRQALCELVKGCTGAVYLIGSSLGGYWASYLAERYNLPAVIVNPSVAPDKMMPSYLNQQLSNYSSDQSYWLEAHHIDELKACDAPELQKNNNYWLLVQTGDEVLDYRAAVAKYQGCKQTVEVGGDHSFQGFERFLPDILTFFRSFRVGS